MTTTYGHDANGNRTTAGADTFTYDMAGRMITATVAVPADDGDDEEDEEDEDEADDEDGDDGDDKDGATETLTFAYAYDGEGKRLRTTTGSPLTGVVTNDLWDITRSVPEIALQRDGSGMTTRRFTYGLGRLSTTTGTETSFYHHDGLGSVGGTGKVSTDGCMGLEGISR